MSKQQLSINLTFEVEQNNTFLFLDIKICCENNKFTTSVCRKPTFNGVFTNFDSFVHLSYEFGVVKTFLTSLFHFMQMF